MNHHVLTLMLASAGLAGAQALPPGWTYALPETGLLPSAASYEFASSMRERHSGASHFGMQSASLTIPFSDPRASSLYGWAFNAELSSTVTFVDAAGDISLENDTLYKLTLPLSFIRPTEQGNRWVVAAAPTVSSDLDCGARCFDLGLFAAYTENWSDSFNFTIGIAGYPRFARYYFVPVFGFEWKPAEDWTVKLRAYELTAMNAVSERLSLGVFAAAKGGVWSVETERGARMLNVQSLVAGVAAEYDFSQAGQRKRIITAALGSTLASSVRFHEYGGSRDVDEAHHYRPGLYASVGVDFRF